MKRKARQEEKEQKTGHTENKLKKKKFGATNRHDEEEEEVLGLADRLVSLGQRNNCSGGFATKLPNGKACKQPILPLISREENEPNLFAATLLEDGYVKMSLGDKEAVAEALTASEKTLLRHESVLVESKSNDKGQNKGLGVLRIGECGLYGITEVPALTRLIDTTIKGLAALQVLPPGKLYLMNGESYARRISTTRFTQAHHDHAYLQSLGGGLGRIANDALLSCLTVWRPLNETSSVGHGVLALMPGSHKCLADNTPEDVKHKWYRAFRDKLPLSYFSDAKEMPWHIGRYEAGDAVVFDSRTVHCASVNETQRNRFSVDFRLVVKPFDYTPEWWRDAAVQAGLEEVQGLEG